MPKNINSITINITLEGIEKIKTEKNDNRTVWTITRAFTSWMAFIFPSMKMQNSWLEITKSCHSTLKNYRRHERKVRQSLFVSVEINSTIAKVTVWYNWLNRVRLAWSRKTYMHFATGHGATTRGIYIRSFFWKKRTTKNVRASTFPEMPTYGDLKSGDFFLPVSPPLPLDQPTHSPFPPLPPKTHPPIPQQLLQNTSIFCRHCEFAGKQGTYVNNFYWLIGDPIKQSVIWLW